MTTSGPSAPPGPQPPGRPNRRLHYLGLAALVIELVAGIAVIL
jgi:hypothetical protein